LWYQIVRNYLEANGISWTIWDYHGGFGVFEEKSSGLFDHDLNVNLLKALGFYVPPQTDFELKPDSTGFGLYSDFIEKGIAAAGYSSGSIDYYYEEAKDGSYAISWINPAQYNSVGFRFLPVKDLSYLEANNYYVGFWVKSDNPFAKFDIRFVDTKENETDHPWRMSYTLDNSENVLDGNWNYVQIPLSSFTETGSWDNAWFEPQGLFDWKAVQLFEIVDEHGVLFSTELMFDEITIFDPNSTDIDEDQITFNYKLHQNFPNPFNPQTTIIFEIPEREEVELRIYDILGKEVALLADDIFDSGNYKIEFSASSAGLSSGVYFYTLTSNGFTDSKKMLLLK